MKKFSKKGVLLFAGAMAVCAFAMPAMASASSWGVVGSHRTPHLEQPRVQHPHRHHDVHRHVVSARILSAVALQITQSTFTGCTFAGPVVGTCVWTPTGTFSTPWTATARTTSDIQIHSVDIDIPFDNHTGSSACAIAGSSMRIVGTLTGIRWHGNTGGRTLELAGASGLVSHSPLTGTVPIVPTGTITDVQETLTVS